MSAVVIGLLVAGAYLGVGALFALWFAASGAGRIDPVAREGTWGFRVLILPAAAALWPLLLIKTVRSARPGSGAEHADSSGAHE